MSYWRWLLFAAMSRFDLREDVYLRIPNVKTIPRDVRVEIYSKRVSGDPLGEDRVTRLARCGRSALIRVASWCRWRSQAG